MNFEPLSRELVYQAKANKPDLFDDTTGLGRKLLKSLLFYDDRFFMDYLCRHWTISTITGLRTPSGEIHEKLWRHFDAEGHSLVVVPRGHAKTTSLSKMKCLKALLFCLEKEILLTSSKKLGETILGDIRKELETNIKLINLFGKQVPESVRGESKAVWRQTEFQLKNGSKIATRSSGQATRGLRPTLLLVDDPQENDDVENPLMAEKYNNWFWTALFPTLPPEGRCLVIGTMLSENCFVNHLKQSHEERFFSLVEYRCLIWPEGPTPNADNLNEWFEHGKALWPEYWTVDKLNRRCREVKIIPFLQEYMNEPQVLNGSPVFSAKNVYELVKPVRGQDIIKWYADPKDKALFLGVDIASGQVGRDFTTIIVRDRDYKLVAQVRAHIGPELAPHYVDMIYRQCESVFIVPEINNHGHAFISKAREYEWFSRIYRKRSMDKITQKMTETVGWTTTAKSKSDAISYLREVYAEGNVEVSDELKHEISKFYHNEKGGMEAIAPNHDDLVIADALACQAIKHGMPAKLVFIPL